MVLGVGMAITVAPLTTAVMSAVDQRRAGIASGINNAVSRVASLLAIAVFGVVLSAEFNRQLDRRIGEFPADVQQSINMQRPKLAGGETHDDHARRVIQESFVSGYRRVLWGAAVLAVASALASAALVEEDR
jgi:hypothetical protein